MGAAGLSDPRRACAPAAPYAPYTSGRCLPLGRVELAVEVRVALRLRHEACPVSTEGWTRRVHFVREGGGGGLSMHRPASAPPETARLRTAPALAAPPARRARTSGPPPGRGAGGAAGACLGGGCNGRAARQVAGRRLWQRALKVHHRLRQHTFSMQGGRQVCTGGAAWPRGGRDRRGRRGRRGVVLDLLRELQILVESSF